MSRGAGLMVLCGMDFVVFLATCPYSVCSSSIGTWEPARVRDTFPPHAVDCAKSRARASVPVRWSKRTFNIRFHAPLNPEELPSA